MIYNYKTITIINKEMVSKSY